MIDDDFPALRAAVQQSMIGRAIAWLATAVMRAAEDAAVTRILRHVRAAKALDTAAAIRQGAVLLAVAAFSSWGLSSFVPPYVATAIPGLVFALVVVLCVIAAITPESLARQWQVSRVRQLIAKPDA